MFRSLYTAILLFSALPLCAQRMIINPKDSPVWDKLITQAKQENKFIILDFYATWCKPCFEMDRAVFGDSATGGQLRKKFIIQKIQVDSTRKDDTITRQWQYVASKLMEPYKVIGFPTFIFLTPQGEIVHKLVGAMNRVRFLEAAMQATDPQHQFYVNITRNALPGHSRARLQSLAKEATTLSHDNLHDSVYRYYIERYLSDCTITSFLSDTSFSLLLDELAYLVRTTDPFFRCMYDHFREFDKIKNDKGYTKDLLASIITQSYPKAVQGSPPPDWPNLRKSLTAQYDEQLSAKVVNILKLSWFHRQKKLDSAAHYLVKTTDSTRTKKLPPNIGTLVTLNNSAYFVFQHSPFHNDLRQALTWTEVALNVSVEIDGQPSVAILDTKANLLYKLGKVKDAKALLRKVIQQDPQFEEAKNNLAKMEKGIPTWKDK